jgi:hypothetical protein
LLPCWKHDELYSELISPGVLPEAYYSTNDAKSFNTFLSRCDILVASLPSTPQTQWMLKREHFGASSLYEDSSQLTG